MKALAKYMLSNDLHKLQHSDALSQADLRLNTYTLEEAIRIRVECRQLGLNDLGMFSIEEGNKFGNTDPCSSVSKVISIRVFPVTIEGAKK